MWSFIMNYMYYIQPYHLRNKYYNGTMCKIHNAFTYTECEQSWSLIYIADKL